MLTVLTSPIAFLRTAVFYDFRHLTGIESSRRELSKRVGGGMRSWLLPNNLWKDKLDNLQSYFVMLLNLQYTKTIWRHR
jgi:hypothetical protein